MHERQAGASACAEITAEAEVDAGKDGVDMTDTMGRTRKSSAMVKAMDTTMNSVTVFLKSCATLLCLTRV